MRDDRLDRRIIGIRRRVGPRENIFVVEDVEALVLHRAHVEGAHRHDHEDVEIVFAAEALLVPFHCALERLHRIAAAILVALFHEDAQRHFPARHGDELVFHMAEIARDQGKEIGRLREGVVPFHEMPPVLRLAALHRVAVRQQNGLALPVACDPRAEHGHVVRPVEIIGDPAKALRLALRAIDALREIEPLKRRVLLRRACRHRFERELALRRLVDRQRLVVDAVAVRSERLAVQPHFEKVQLLAIEHERRIPFHARRVPFHLEGGMNPGGLWIEVDVEHDLMRREGGNLVVLEADRARVFGTHGRGSAAEGIFTLYS